MLTSGNTENRSHIRFRLDGAVKSLTLPVTGAALHTIAGNPEYLVTAGHDVPNTPEPFDLEPDQEVFTRPALGEKTADPLDFKD